MSCDSQQWGTCQGLEGRQATSQRIPGSLHLGTTGASRVCLHSMSPLGNPVDARGTLGAAAAGSLLEAQTEHSDIGRTEGSLFTPTSGPREWTLHLQKAQTPQATAVPETGLPLFQTTQGARFTKPPGDRPLGAWRAAARFLATSTWPGALLCAERLPRQSSVKTKASAKTTEPSASGTTSAQRPLALRAEC